MKRVCAYVRVSTASQDTGSQLLAIKQSIERSEDVLFEVYSDEGMELPQFTGHFDLLEQGHRLQ